MLGSFSWWWYDRLEIQTGWFWSTPYQSPLWFSWLKKTGTYFILIWFQEAQHENIKWMYIISNKKV